jgi:hypothetical protein
MKSMGGTEMKVVATILTFLIGVILKFLWNKLKGHEDRHDKVEAWLKDIDERLDRRVNDVENRTTAIESSTVSKDDLFNAITTINEQAQRRDERIYAKLDEMMTEISSLRYNQARHGQDNGKS